MEIACDPSVSYNATIANALLYLSDTKQFKTKFKGGIFE